MQSALLTAAADTMYKRRLSTVGNIDTMLKAGFTRFCRDAPGLMDGLLIDIDYVFMTALSA